MTGESGTSPKNINVVCRGDSSKVYVMFARKANKELELTASGHRTKVALKFELEVRHHLWINTYEENPEALGEFITKQSII